ncbi:MAG: cytochrome P450 [Labilithrix sp.]|nr:cytochrome P450 [Labilithrix sp.]MCW5817756.1 cytochrome P450 [Labilithrix sp.]
MPTLPPRKHSMAYSSWRWMRSPYPYLDELRALHGESFRLGIFGMEVNVFSNPDDVREVFSDGGDELEAGRFNQTLAVLLGDRSVLMVDGEKHLRKRKLLLPPFHGERMQAYGQTMLDVTDDAIDAMPHGRPFAFHESMQDVTLRVIVRTIFGFEGPRLEQMVTNTKRLLDLGAWAPLLIPAMQFELGGYSPYGRFRRAVDASNDLLHREIDGKRASGVRGPDILSLLLDARDDAGEPMSREELRDELVTLLVAGHETTATALSWAMKHLLEQPALFAELHAEVEALGPDPKPEAINKAPLLDGVVREALRLIPVIPIVGRVLATDRTVGGMDMKKGELVVCSIYLAHRRPEAFPNPETFDPRRFVGKKLSAHEFFPFGGGIRRCIGMAFAVYEMKMVLARLVSRCGFAFEGKKPVRMVRRSITITPSEGLRLVLEKRKLRPSLAIRAA